MQHIPSVDDISVTRSFVLCVRRYLRYPLSYRNLEEMIAERALAVDHSTIAGWVLTYAPVLNERIRSEMRHPGRSWRSTKHMCGSAHSGPIYIERSTRLAAKEECLSKLILFGEASLWRALSEFVDHHAERNHQGKGNVILFPRQEVGQHRLRS